MGPGCCALLLSLASLLLVLLTAPLSLCLCIKVTEGNIIELETKLREDITITEKAPARS